MFDADLGQRDGEFAKLAHIGPHVFFHHGAGVRLPREKRPRRRRVRAPRERCVLLDYFKRGRPCAQKQIELIIEHRHARFFDANVRSLFLALCKFRFADAHPHWLIRVDKYAAGQAIRELGRTAHEKERDWESGALLAVWK